MTKVYLANNPFTVKTTMVVNDEQVKSTSTLYRYRNTPLQDWVGSFLPELVAHCNDDEIEITFHGLQYHFEAMEQQVQAYTSKNRDIEIVLHHEVSKSQVARMGALSAIMDEIQITQELIPELKTEENKKRIKDSYDVSLESVIISSIDRLKVNVINKLIDHPVLTEGNDRMIKIIDNDKLKGIRTAESDEDFFDCVELNIPFVNSKHARLVITDTGNSLNQEARYYRYIKKVISSPHKPIILFFLHDNGSNNNEEFLNLISEQFNQKGKQNKERFIFIAENQSKAKKMLYSDYTIRNPLVFCPDDIPGIQRQFKKYMEEYCFIGKITNTCSEWNRLLEEVESQLHVTDKQSVEHDVHLLFIKIKELLSRTVYQWSSLISVEAIQAETSKLIKMLENEFNSVLKKSESTKRSFNISSIFGDPTIALRPTDVAKKNTKNYIQNSLKKRIETFLRKKILEIIQGSRIEFIFPETLISIFKSIDLQDSMNPYLDSSFSETLTKSLETTIVDVKLQETIKEIENIEIKTYLVGLKGIMFGAGLSGKGGSKPSSDENVDPNFLIKLAKVTSRELNSDSTYLESAKVDACKKVFKENITKLGPIINEELISFTSLLNTKLPIYEQAKTNMVDELMDQAEDRLEELKEQALKSKKIEERQAYLEQLSQKLNAITEL